MKSSSLRIPKNYRPVYAIIVVAEVLAKNKRQATSHQNITVAHESYYAQNMRRYGHWKKHFSRNVGRSTTYRFLCYWRVHLMYFPKYV